MCEARESVLFRTHRVQTTSADTRFIKWLNRKGTVDITGDLSQLLVLEINNSWNADVNPLLDVCKSSLRELSYLADRKNPVIDAGVGLKVLRLYYVKNVCVITAASAPLDLLTVMGTNFPENQDSLTAKRVWLSGNDSFDRGDNSLRETVYLRAYMESITWNASFEAVISGVASTLKALSISPMLELPSFQTLEFVFLPTAADFIRVLGSQLKGIAFTIQPSEIALQQVRDTVGPNIECILPFGRHVRAEENSTSENMLFQYLARRAI